MSTLRVTVDFGRRTGGGWPVETRWLDAVEAYDTVATAVGATFVPTAPDGGTLDPTVFGNIAARTPAPGDASRLGRHLFDAALGAERWERILAAMRQGGTGQITLRLRMVHDDGVLGRQHWELLHDGRQFLGVSAERVAIVRVVPALPGSPPLADVTPIRGAPKVLFAVGSDIHDPDVRPGAEFLGLMQELDQDSRNLTDVRLLNGTTLERLGRKIESFRPDVVHLVCHGVADGDRPTLEFRSDLPGDRVTQVTAEQLLPTLLSRPDSPPLVVLSACDSARAYGPEVASFAGALVAGGIRVVVGMSGRVTDQTCRLFGRRFGASLVNGRPVALAVADGRRAAFQGDRIPPEDSVDWALPALFLADDVDETISAVEVPPGATAKDRLERYDIGWRGHGIPAFAGRLPHLEAFERVQSGSARALLLHARSRSVGLRRLTDELMARAFRAGDVVVNIPTSESKKYPQTLAHLLIDLLKRTSLTRAAFLGERTGNVEVPAFLVQSQLMQSFDALLPADDLRPGWETVGTSWNAYAKFERAVLAADVDDGMAEFLVRGLMADLGMLLAAVRGRSAVDPTISPDAGLWLVLPQLQDWGPAGHHVWDHFVAVDPRLDVGHESVSARLLLTYLGDRTSTDPFGRLNIEFSGPQLERCAVECFDEYEEQLAIPWVLLHPLREPPSAARVYVADDAAWHAAYRSFVQTAREAAEHYGEPALLRSFGVLPDFFHRGFYNVVSHLEKSGVFHADDVPDDKLLAAFDGAD